MLNPIELNGLIEDKDYKKTKKISYNLKHIDGLLKPSLVSPNLSFSVNSNLVATFGVTKAIFVKLFKAFFLAYEIGKIRNEIVERALNNSIEQWNIRDFCSERCYWFEDDSKKIELMKKITKQFLTNSQIQTIIYNHCTHLNSSEKNRYFNELLEKVDKKFFEALAERKEKNATDAIYDLNELYRESGFKKNQFELNNIHGELTSEVKE